MSKLTLIIPDIHHRVDQATRIIESVCPDEVIFLGDYFDDFRDDPETVTHTCEWLLDSVNKPNRIHLTGNHDVHYMFPEDHWKCSGYEQWKYFLIHDFFEGTDVFKKLKFYHVLDNKFLLTHAGLDKHILPKSLESKHGDRDIFFKEIADWLDNEIIQGFRQKSDIFRAGSARWGKSKWGGIIWSDFDHEFCPVTGLNQILGHTPRRRDAEWLMGGIEQPLVRTPYTDFMVTEEDINNVSLSHNLCLDVHGNTHWAVWNGKTIEIGNYKDHL